MVRIIVRTTVLMATVIRRTAIITIIVTMVITITVTATTMVTTVITTTTSPWIGSSRADDRKRRPLRYTAAQNWQSACSTIASGALSVIKRRQQVDHGLSNFLRLEEGANRAIFCRRRFAKLP
jgi:hypothetical protein